jgi:arylsulfatase A-like enzyme
MKSPVPVLLLAFAACAPAADLKRPNILFALADDWGLHAGAYGTKWVRTPAFDRVAREGLLFSQAYTPTAKCAPSRASILTGRNPWQLKAAVNHMCHFPMEFKTCFEALGEKGWFTGHTLKGWSPGRAVDAAGKHRQMTGPAFNARKAAPPASGISDNDYAGNFEDFLDAAPADAPWCFWYGSIEPHREYEFGSGVIKGGKKLTDIDRVPGYWPDNDTVRNDLLDYAFEIEHFDRHLGRMLEMLERRGLLENTLVVVTSDNGMPFPRVKGNTYGFANHLPLAIMWKGGILKPGRTIDDFISFIDFAPTFIDLAGLKWQETGMAAPEGRSLTDIFRSERSGRIDPARDHVLIGRERNDIGRPHDAGYPTRGIIREGWLYLRNFEPDRWPACNPETGYLDCDAGATKTFLLDARRRQGADPHWSLCFGLRPGEELYNLREDPDCLRNLAQAADAAAKRESLAAGMLKSLKEQGDPRVLGEGGQIDRYPTANPQHVGFYERFMKGERPVTNWILETDIEPSPISP